MKKCYSAEVSRFYRKRKMTRMRRDIKVKYRRSRTIASFFIDPVILFFSQLSVLRERSLEIVAFSTVCSIRLESSCVAPV